jgi:hypothetical protein
MTQVRGRNRDQTFSFEARASARLVACRWRRRTPTKRAVRVPETKRPKHRPRGEQTYGSVLAAATAHSLAHARLVRELLTHPIHATVVRGVRWRAHVVGCAARTTQAGTPDARVKTFPDSAITIAHVERAGLSFARERVQD